MWGKIDEINNKCLINIKIFQFQSAAEPECTFLNPPDEKILFKFRIHSNPSLSGRRRKEANLKFKFLFSRTVVTNCSHLLFF